MKDLIKISDKSLVSAKELYLGLGLIKKNWSRWYPINIEKNDFFTENADWVRVPLKEEGNETIDFAISIEFAKHIAMMARTEKSHEYRNYFIQCEKALKESSKPQCLEDVLIQSLQEMKAVRLQLEEVKKLNADNKQEIQSMRDVITLNPTQWRKDTTALINKMALISGGYDHIKAIREESYKLLNERFGVDVHTRITNKRRRMADEGVCKSRRDKLTVLDVIADDKKLIEGYVAIIKEMSIKYKVA